MVAGIASGKQLAFKIARYRSARSIRKMIVQELAEGELDADVAVENVLEFVRQWATFSFPRYLMAVDRIQRAVFEGQGRSFGDYSTLAAQLENQFLPAGIAALDEYGLPVQVAEKLSKQLGSPESLDEALAKLRDIQAESVPGLDDFERALLADTLEAL
jgi:hypothetical protein